MHRDLIIGIVVSLALHSSIWVFSRKNEPPKRAVAVKEEVMQFEMPPLEEEKVEEVEQLNEEPIETVMAPPSLVDVPSVVPVDAFVQQLDGGRILVLLATNGQPEPDLALELDREGEVVWPGSISRFAAP